MFENKKLFIFDMDGTIYLGNRVFGFAIDFIKKLREHGKRVMFFTNNASHNPDFYVKKLERMGFEPSTEEIMTSGDVTIKFLKSHRAGKSVYLVGTDELMTQFENEGIKLISDSEASAGADADIAITSFDTGLTYERLNNVCRMVRNGSEYLSTHPDYNCPTEDGFIPDSGAIAAFVTASTGVEPTYFGKPYVQTVEMISEYTGLSRDEMCVFGDRLYTDIAMGKLHGVTATLVLTGETTEADVASAKPEQRPDYVFKSLYEVDKEMFG